MFNFNNKRFNLLCVAAVEKILMASDLKEISSLNEYFKGRYLMIANEDHIDIGLWREAMILTDLLKLKRDYIKADTPRVDNVPFD